MLKVIISLFAVLGLGGAAGSGAAAGGTLCGMAASGTLSILTSERLAGEVTFEGYRLTADGSLSRAQWTGENALLAISETVSLGREAFAEARRRLGDVAPAERDAGAGGTTPSPAVKTYEIAISDGARPVRFVYRTRPSPAVSALIEAWDEAAPLAAPAAGDFIWSVPLAHDPGRVDVTISSGACAAAGAARVAASLVAPHLVSRQTAEMTGAMNIDRTGRQRLVADLPSGFAYFGVVTAR